MDISMNIAAMSVSMSQAKVQQSASVAVLSKVMDAQETAAADMIQSLEEIAPLDHVIDMKV